MKKVIYNRDIYSDSTIKTAMEIYHNIATTTVRFKNNQATIIFWKCLYEENRTIQEFENYMIGLENL